MHIPFWAIFGIFSATLSTGVFLTQERMRLNGFVLAFWNKACCALFAFPLMLYFGAPESALFYIILTAQACLWVVSDVIFFNTINKTGAGVVSRLLPLAVIVTFVLWFFIDPSTLDKYMQTPLRSLGVVLALCASVYFVMRLRKCPLSWAAFRMVWFVIFSAVIGPLLGKLVMGEATFAQGPFAYVFFQALVMVLMWLVYYAIKRPIPAQELFNRRALKGGLIVSVFSFFMIASSAAGLKLVDNPGLMTAVGFSDTMLILLYYKLTKREDHSDWIAGLGVVFCAAIIIVLKSLGT